MHTFRTHSEAVSFVTPQVDSPVLCQHEQLTAAVSLETSTQNLPDGRFVNIYDLSFQQEQATPSIFIPDEPRSVRGHLNRKPKLTAASSGGFFFLADGYSRRPRVAALNLAVANGTVRSLPVTDREALVIERGLASARRLRALGELSVNGRSLSWAGSNTEHEADCYVFGTGNSIIQHVQDEITGSRRVLYEPSSYTPLLEPESDWIDVGFNTTSDNQLTGTAESEEGGLDIFAHTLVLRLPKSYVSRDYTNMLRIHSVDSFRTFKSNSAISSGPLLSGGYEQHPINSDMSLGSKPPFTNRPMARLAMFGTEQGTVHLQLFDGRPGSVTFSGVTPDEAAQTIRNRHGNVVWGCFLDPGQTAKLATRNQYDESTDSYGNMHYIRWPKKQSGKYRWVPQIGRPVASIITVQ